MQNSRCTRAIARIPCFIFEESGNYYRPATAAEAENPTGSGATTTVKANQTTGTNGTRNSAFVIQGLDQAGTHSIKESATPGGYYAPAGTFTVQMKSRMNGEEHTGNLESGTFTASNPDQDGALIGSDESKISSNQFVVTLQNSTAPSLPTAGGMGTILLAIAGVVLMIGAGAFFVFLRRKQH